MNEVEENYHPNLHQNHHIDLLDGERKAYVVFDAEGRQRLATIEAKELSEVSERTEALWPCRVKATHLPYRYVDIEFDGTLSFPVAD